MSPKQRNKVLIMITFFSLFSFLLSFSSLCSPLLHFFFFFLSSFSANFDLLFLFSFLSFLFFLSLSPFICLSHSTFHIFLSLLFLLLLLMTNLPFIKKIVHFSLANEQMLVRSIVLLPAAFSVGKKKWRLLQAWQGGRKEKRCQKS